MDGWVDGWVDGWMAGWLAGWMDGWMASGWMAGWVDGWVCEWMDDWLGGWMAGWVKDGQLDVGGQMSGWTDSLEDSSTVATCGSHGHTGAAGQAGSGLLKPGHCLPPELLLVSRPLSREVDPIPGSSPGALLTLEWVSEGSEGQNSPEDLGLGSGGEGEGP